MRTGLGLILIAAMLAVSPASAEFYKYVDENGNIRFTDDITMVPPEQRNKLRKYQDYKAEPDAVGGEPGAQAAETPPETPKPAQVETSNEGLAEQGKRLEEQRAKLDTEYKALLDARRVLESRSGEFRTRSALREYETQIMQLNERNATYEARRQAYDTEVSEYNAKVEKLRQETE